MQALLDFFLANAAVIGSVVGTIIAVVGVQWASKDKLLAYLARTEEVAEAIDKAAEVAQGKVEDE